MKMEMIETECSKLNYKLKSLDNFPFCFIGGDEKTQQSITEKKSFMTQDTRRLNKFLGRAAQVC